MPTPTISEIRSKAESITNMLWHPQFKHQLDLARNGMQDLVCLIYQYEMSTKLVKKRSVVVEFFRRLGRAA